MVQNDGACSYPFHHVPKSMLLQNTAEYSKCDDSENELNEFSSLDLFKVQNGPKDPDFLKSIRQGFERDGFVCLKAAASGGFLTDEILKKIQKEAMFHFNECFRILYSQGKVPFPSPYRLNPNSTTDSREYALGCGVKNGYQEIVMRSPGRFEMTFGCDPSGKFNNEDHFESNGIFLKIRKIVEGIQQNTLFHSILRSISSNENSDGSDIYLCNFSIVISSPGAMDQGWHADGGHVDISKHLPCHCFNVFVPLVDLTNEKLGPTEIRPGTHFHTRNLAPMMLAAKARKTLRPTVTFPLRAGNMLVFDYRVLHRGKANTTLDCSRPILVMTYARTWFKDRLNFPKKSIFDQ